MKAILLSIAATCLMFLVLTKIGCHSPFPRSDNGACMLGGKMIITSVKKDDDMFSVYSTDDGIQIVDWSGKFNIGDTLYISKHKY